MSTASPVLKQTMDISGSNFGTDDGELAVYLYDPESDSNLYELAIFTISDTDMTVILGGGRTGDYKLRVVNYLGASVDVDFSYKIIVNSVTPKSGSKLGGTLLTIEGDNFSVTKTDN
jgi:hypothetical protein